MKIKSNYFLFIILMLVSIFLVSCENEQAQQFKVTFFDYDNTILKEEIVEDGGSATAPTDPKREGYTFIGWDTDFSNITMDLFVNALYEHNAFTVTFVDNEGNIIEIQTVHFDKSAIFPKDPTKEGYLFKGWTEGNFDNIKEDTTIVAYFEIKTYTVVFKDHDGSYIHDVIVEHGSAAIAPADPSIENCIFVGWSIDFNDVRTDLEVFAMYEELPMYNINFRGIDGEIFESYTLYHNEKLIKVEFPNVIGYTYLGLFLDKDFTIPLPEVLPNVTADMDLYLLYVKSIYQVTFVDFNGKILHKEMVTHGSTVVPPDGPEIEGYTFIGWDKLLSNITSDLTIKTVYQINSYNVTFLDYNGEVLKNTQVEYGKQALPPENPIREGHTFYGWDKEYNIISGHLDIIALYKRNPYTLTFDTVGGDSLAPQIEEYDTHIILPIPTKEGSVFGGWLLNNEIVKEVYLSNDLTVKAIWINKIILNTNSDYSMEDIEVKFGTVITSLPTPIRVDYTFEGWLLYGEQVLFPFTFLENNNIEFVAKWSAKTDDGIVFEINDDEVTIISYLGDNINVIIPNSIAGANVTRIGECAFLGRNDINSIVVPNSVIEIEQFAFLGLSNLTSITLPFVGANRNASGHYAQFGYIFGYLSYDESYSASGGYLPNKLNEVIITDEVNIGTSAFRGASSLTKIVLPDSLINIDSSAFYGTSNLTNIVIPNSVRSIGSYAFSLSGVEKIEFQANSKYKTISSYTFFEANKLKEFIIPNSVINIEPYAFENSGIEYISFEANSQLDELGESSFAKAYNLKRITIPHNIKSIGTTAFYETTNLTSFKLPNSITSLGQSIFFNSGLQTITFEENSTLKEIGNSSFRGAKCLSIIELPNSVISIADYAFSETHSLKQLIIPNAVISIGKYAFYMSAIETVEFEENSQLEEIGNYSFHNASILRNIVIPNGVSKIGDYAFSNTQSLNYILIPKSVKVVGVSAFSNSGLEKIDFEENSRLEEISQFSFSGLSKLSNLIIPNSVKIIKSSAFSGASNLASITLPFIGESRESDKFFGYIFGEVNYNNSYKVGVFHIPKSLTEVIISDGPIIGQYAFKGVSSIKRVVISNSITFIDKSAFEHTGVEIVEFEDNSQLQTISTSAFANTSNLKSIVIPNSVIRIDVNAFANSGLTSVLFEENSQLREIGENSFSGLNNLTSIIIPNSVLLIEESAFSGASNLNTITLPIKNVRYHLGYIFGRLEYEDSYNSSDYYLPKTLTNVIITDMEVVRSGFFFEAKNIENIILPSNLNEIEQYAFSGTTNLKYLFIPSSVTSIGEYAFSNSGIEQISFDEKSNLEIIGKNAFREATMLNNIVIPNSVKAIGSFSFFDTTSLKNIIIPNNVIIIEEYSFSNSGLENILFEENSSLNNIGIFAFANLKNLTNIAIPNSVRWMDGLVFSGSYNLRSITLPFVGQARGFASHFGFIFGAYSYEESYQASGYFIPKSLIEIIISDETLISDNAFSNITNVRSITISDFVTSIGNNAFSNTTNLKELFIPNSVETIGSGAFSNSGIEYIRFEENSKLEQINSHLFRYSNKLKSILIPNSVTNIMANAFSDSGIEIIEFEENSKIEVFSFLSFADTFKLKKIIIPSSVKIIDRSSFHNAVSLKSIVIPNSVETIGSGAFSGASSLESITLPFVGESRSTLPRLGYIFGRDVYENSYYASGYYVPNALTEVIITDAHEIGSYAFENVTKLTNIIIPNSVTSIGANAFIGASGLTNIIIPNSVTSIGANAFIGASGITNIVIPNSVISIGAYAFYKSMLETIEFEKNSKLEVIGNSAFAGSNKLSSITIPNSVTDIGLSVFAGASSLRTITLPFVGLSRDSIKPFGYIFGMVEYENSYLANGYYIPNTLKEVIITDALEIPYSAFRSVSKVNKIILPNGVLTIGQSAFYETSDLESITIPSSVTWVGSNAFSYSGINSIIFEENSNLKRIEPNTFSYASNLTSVEIPKGVTSIGSSAFIGTTSLTNVKIPYGVTIIESSAFNNAISITDIIIPNSVTTIESSAFYGAISITDIIIPSSVTTIGLYAFAGMSSLNTIVIPSNVTKIGENAFKDSNNLTIFTELNSQPTNWHYLWNSQNRPVYWGNWNYDENGVPTPSNPN